MTWQASVWALKQAPVYDSLRKMVLMGLADHAHDDGTKAFPTRRTIAEYACCSTRTVSRILAEFEDQGLISRGDQRMVKDFPEHLRPVVWDLNMSMVKPRPGDTMSPADTPDTGDTGVTRPRDTGDKGPVTVVSHITTNKPPSKPPIKDSSLGADAPTPPDDDQEQDRPEVILLCDLLADSIENRGSKRPTVTKEWLRQCRLLIDNDHRSERQVRNMIDWLAAGADEDAQFWQGNIRSMPKLRAKYDVLRERRLQRSTPAAKASSSTTTLRVTSAMDRAARYAAMAEPTPTRQEITQ